MKKIIFSAFTLIASFCISNAQVSSYVFSQSTGAYTAITGGSLVATTTGTTGAGTLDNVVYNLPAASFPFTFTFNGIGYTGCNISTNAFITFGTTAPALTNYTPISGTALFEGSISAWGGDLNSMHNAGASSLRGEIRFETIGVAPNREVVIQYSNWRPSYTTSTTNIYGLNFQIHLHETSNNVSIVYGPNAYVVGSTVITNTRQVGLRGATNADYNNRLNAAAVSFTASTAGSANNSTQTFSTTGTTPGMPVDGLTYLWVSPTCYPPTALTITNIATTTTDLSWTAPSLGTPGNYNWEVRTSGAAGSGTTGLVTSGSVVAPTTSIAISGLSPITSYSAYVRSDCGAGDFSIWSSVKTFTTIANCPVPISLTISAITPTSAVSTWTAGSTETSWLVNYMTPTTTVVTASPLYSLTGLNPSTTYSIQIKGICAVGDSSTWTAFTTFMTPCLPPSILTTTPSTRCGTGTATLAATGDVGATLNWYTNSTGGVSVGTGTLFTTPTITTTTDFYVSAVGGLVTENVGRVAAASATGFITTPNWGIIFNTTKNVLVNSATIYPVGTGSVTIALLDATGAELAVTPALAVTGTGTNTPVVVNLGFNVPTGNNFKIVLKAYTGITNLIRDGSGNVFPYTSASNALSITGGWTGTASSASYYWFYNLNISTGCESTRTAVTASVTAPPVLSVTSGSTICANAIQTLSVTSTLSDFDNYVWTPSTNLFTDGTATTAYTGNNQTILYYSSPLNNNTTYTLTATNTLNGCVNNTTVSMEATMPVIYASANPTIACSGNTVQLTANTDIIATGTVATGTATTLTGATAQPTAFCNRWSSYRMQTVYTASELTAFGLASGNITSISYSISTLGDAATNANFTVKCGTTTATAFTNFIATTGFSTVFTPAIYTHSVGLNTIIFNTPYFWDGVSNLVIEVSHDGANAINNSQTYYTATFANTVAWSTNGGATGTLSKNRLNTIINGQTISQGVGTVTWQWNPGAVNTNTTAVNPVNTGTTTTTESYTVTALDPATTCTNSAVVNFSVSPLPTVIATASSASVCAGSSATLTASGATNYTWTAAGTASTQVVTPSSASVYTVTGETSGCSNTTTVSVGVNPIPTVSVSASNTLVCSNIGESSTLTASTSATSYTWSTTENTSVITVTPSVGTTYSLTVSDGTCEATATVFVDAQVCSGVKELVVNGISVYPNPTNGIVNISISSELAGNTSIEVYDAIGKLTIKENLTSNTTTINTSKLVDGIYVFKIINNNTAIKIGKIVKQ